MCGVAPEDAPSNVRAVLCEEDCIELAWDPPLAPQATLTGLHTHAQVRLHVHSKCMHFQDIGYSWIVLATIVMLRLTYL